MMLTVSVGLALAVLLQAAPPGTVASTTTVAKSKPSFVLKVSGGILGTAEIQAKGTPTKAIVEQLKADLKIPFHVSPVVAEHKVDLPFKKSPTTALLLALAPVVLADLEVSLDETVWTGIHLLGFNEKEPARALKQVGFLLIAGVPPEDGPGAMEEAEARTKKLEAQGLEEEPKPEKPVLTVVVTDGRVSVRARQQQLVALLNEIAAKSRIPFDIRGTVDTVPIDIELRDLPLRDVMVALGRPGVRLVIRRNVATDEEFVQGIVTGDARSPLVFR